MFKLWRRLSQRLVLIIYLKRVKSTIGDKKDKKMSLIVSPLRRLLKHFFFNKKLDQFHDRLDISLLKNGLIVPQQQTLARLEFTFFN
jgi:hypothetical protein